MRRIGAVLVALLTVSMLASCVDDESSSPDESVPAMGWFVDGGGGDCAATPEQVRGQSQSLVDVGLRDAGYRTVLVLCTGSGRAKYRTPEMADFLGGLGLRIGFLTDGRSVFPADMPRTEALRTTITRRVMQAEALIPSADPATVSADNVKALTNRAVLDLLRDPRAAPGAPVHDDPSVFSRAVGERGLLVSLTNGTGADREMSVGVKDLGLAGDDIVPAHNAWTGERIVASAGDLTVGVKSGDSALLRIG